MLANKGEATPPTMLQNIGRGATHKRVGWHAEHNVHLLMIDLHAARTRPFRRIPRRSHRSSAPDPGAVGGVACRRRLRPRSAPRARRVAGDTPVRGAAAL